MSREKLLRFTSKNLLQVIAAFILIGTISFWSMGGCSNNSGGGDGFPQPREIRSVNGVLRTTLETFIATNLILNSDTGQMDEINTPTYNGGLIGPTFRINPGDSIQPEMLNNFPDNPENQRLGAFPKDPFTTNLHTHGLTVDPGGISDNVFRQMPPGTLSPVQIDVGLDHQNGTFWYHPHKHGSVSFQFFGGMFGFLIIEGGPGDLTEVPEIAAAREVLMGFAVIRTDQDGNVPFVNQQAQQFSSDQGTTNGLWGTFQNSNAYYTTNGETNPTLRMRPGEVQYWRLLNAASGETLPISLQGHSLHILANDGINQEEMISLGTGQAYVMGAGNRVDLLVKAGEPGTYLLEVLNPSNSYSITPQGIAPGPRVARIGGDFPSPSYPVTLATIVVEGQAKNMDLPDGPLPQTSGIPSRQEMLTTPVDATRNVAMELCGLGGQQTMPENRLPSCGWYHTIYDTDYWGGVFFENLLMLRDADDIGIPNPIPDPVVPRIDYQKEGLFTASEPLFDNMVAGNYEEWTVINRSFSDHPSHIHVNPFLVTHINGVPLPEPEWRDTILIPAATGGNGNINDADWGTVTYRTFYDPVITGSFVMHCHILTHEDVGMMQRMDIAP